MSIVVTGSLAFDHIMVFHDRFRAHILPEKIHLLNVSFMVDELSRHFGGTAGNVAYNLALLGQKPIVLGVGGKDFGDYADRLIGLGLSTKYIRIFPDAFTAQAFITTDLDDNQIAAFHPGAMKRANEQPLSVIRGPISLVLIGPNQVQAILAHADHCRRNRIPFWFDPGQSLTELAGDELVAAFTGADGMVLNDYEWEMLRSKSGLSEIQILQLVKTVLVTLGEKGVDMLSVEPLKNSFSRKGAFQSFPVDVHRQHVSAVPNIRVVDPTGAGDAFRAGLLCRLSNGHSFADSCRYACAVASFAVECAGTQNHQFTLEDVERRVRSIID